jgi:hypothetical protein
MGREGAGLGDDGESGVGLGIIMTTLSRERC